jgi:stage V sporulation protein D (sporulation-specific penicillin-binding protein)
MKIEKTVGDKIRLWIKEKKIVGVNIDEDSKRYYPNRDLASNVLGFTGTDNQGLDGIEKTMDKYLKGYPGKIVSGMDASNHALPFGEETRIEPKDGNNVVLTIDESIQYFAEKAINKAIIDNKVLNGASALVMDPRTGDILAMVSRPDYDPNSPFSCPPSVDKAAWDTMTLQQKGVVFNKVWRNKSVSDTYEPGSTFKAITSAAGLEEGVINPQSIVNDFPVTVQGRTIKCWRYYKPHGAETFAEGVYNSCNPVFVRLAQSLGITKFYDYVKAFGFYDKTGIEVPGESGTIFHKKPKEVDMAVASFGQRFQITPIQIISAYSAIANGGNLMKPRLVKEITDNQGNIIQKFEPEVVRKVISTQTSETLRGILEGVVSKGTGENAYISGYRIAGKTGTSETTETKTKGRYIASFTSFAPADNPVICVLVILDYPTGPFGYMGGVIAAPVAREILKDSLDYLGVEKRFTAKEKEEMKEPVSVSVPDVKGKSVAEARKALTPLGLEYKVEGDVSSVDAIVQEQTPAPWITLPKGSVVILYTYKPNQLEKVKMPNILNETVPEAIETLSRYGLNIQAVGVGVAVDQQFEPGTLVDKGKVIKVEFRSLQTD